MSSGHDPDFRLNRSAGLLSVGVASFLVGIKLWALLQTGSLSIGATLADSAMDLFVSVGGLLAILYAARPADEDHAFGHTSVEDLVALGQAVIISLSAMFIGQAAVARLLSSDPPGVTEESSGIAVMLVSIIVTIALVLWQRHVARRTGSKVVAADSLHYIGDLLPNMAAMGALIASAWWDLGQIDALVALAAAAIMISAAFRIGRGAWDALMDRGADPEIIAGIARIARSHPGVLGFHDLKTRVAGSQVFVNLDIELDGRQSLHDAHEIGVALRRAIMSAYPRTDVLIHHDPVMPAPEDPLG